MGTGRPERNYSARPRLVSCLLAGTVPSLYRTQEPSGPCAPDENFPVYPSRQARRQRAGVLRHHVWGIAAAKGLGRIRPTY